jgi:hypothetical protein
MGRQKHSNKKIERMESWDLRHGKSPKYLPKNDQKTLCISNQKIIQNYCNGCKKILSCFDKTELTFEQGKFYHKKCFASVLTCFVCSRAVTPYNEEEVSISRSRTKSILCHSECFTSTFISKIAPRSSDNKDRIEP